jgi:hypothetical protein
MQQSISPCRHNALDRGQHEEILVANLVVLFKPNDTALRNAGPWLDIALSDRFIASSTRLIQKAKDHLIAMRRGQRLIIVKQTCPVVFLASTNLPL